MIVIPGRIVRFLEQCANVAFAGTRDSNLVPHGHRVSGWDVGPGGRTLTALLSAPVTSDLFESLQDNGQFALTVEEFPSHETYQFKGGYLRHRPAQPEDLVCVDRIRDRFVKGLRHAFADAPDEMLRAFVDRPGLAVEFEVREIYVQTPGPGAGARLAPSVENS
jgi:hypothetical protein